MSANVEPTFYTRIAPWHGLGVCVESALDSGEALEKSGLDWRVIQRPIMTGTYDPIPGYKANIRETDERVLGIVTDRYRVVQNAEAFAFTDALLGEGIRYETAGSLQEGRKIGMLAKLPDKCWQKSGSPTARSWSILTCFGPRTTILHVYTIKIIPLHQHNYLSFAICQVTISSFRKTPICRFRI